MVFDCIKSTTKRDSLRRQDARPIDDRDGIETDVTADPLVVFERQDPIVDEGNFNF